MRSPTHPAHHRQYRGRERGSSLVMFLGVVATLTIMAAALLMLVLNTQRSSGREAGRTRAFHVAEAALDVGMMELSKAWPTDPGATFAFSDASYRSAFRGTFDESEFPDPRTSGASFVSVQVIDDEISSNHYDYGPNGPNGRLIVDAQAVVGTSSARIRALVQANYYPVPIAPDTSGHGELGLDRKTEGGEPSPNNVVFQIYQWPADPNQIVYFSSNAALPDPSLGAVGMEPRIETRENILPTAAIEDIVQLAKDKNRYFGQDADQPHVSPDGSQHTYSAASAAWAAAQQEYGLTGLIVVDAPADQTLQLGPGDINTDLTPGILLVMDRRTSAAASLTLVGNTTFTGLIYSQGDVELSGNGTIQVVGAAITDGYLILGGTANIFYHAGVLARLSSQIVTRTRFVPGGWRELSPDPARAP